jgi:hypothetical protein
VHQQLAQAKMITGDVGRRAARIDCARNNKPTHTRLQVPFAFSIRKKVKHGGSAYEEAVASR